MSQTFARLRSLCPTVSVGMLTADLMNLGSELELLERAGVGIVHVDVMDGCFCPQMTVGPAYVKGLRTPLLKDVHLMIREPLDTLDAYAAAGADILTVHVESAVHIHRVLQHLGGAGERQPAGRGHRAWAGSRSGHAARMAGAAAGRDRHGDHPGRRSGLEWAEVRAGHSRPGGPDQGRWPPRPARTSSSAWTGA